MKVRLIKKIGYTTLYAIEVKRWWWPFWKEVLVDGYTETEAFYERLLRTKSIVEVVKEGEIK